MDNWWNALANRFKLNDQEALKLLKKASYSLKDVRNRRPLASYVQSVIRYGNSAGLPTKKQLQLAYKHMAGELQRDISKPTSATSVEDFIRALEAKESAWRQCWDQREPREARHQQIQEQFGSRQLSSNQGRQQGRTNDAGGRRQSGQLNGQGYQQSRDLHRNTKGK